MGLEFMEGPGIPRTVSRDESGGRDTTYALFVQDEIHILESLTAYIGAREDWWRVFDGFANTIGAPGYPQQFSSNTFSYFSPKGALVYTPFEGTVLRGSLGEAFRPPTLFNLFRTWTSVSGVTYNSNPYLKAGDNHLLGDRRRAEALEGGRVQGDLFRELCERSDLPVQRQPHHGQFQSTWAGRISRGSNLRWSRGSTPGCTSSPITPTITQRW